MPIERVSLTQPIETRDGTLTKDSRSVNCVFESSEQKRECIKRPGLKLLGTLAAGQAQGCYEFNNKLISVVNNTVYQTTIPGMVTTTIGTISGPIKNVSFAKDFLNSNLFFHNKTNAYVLTSSGVLKHITNDSVVSATVTFGGTGYSSGTTVNFTSPTSGITATGTVNVSSGSIMSINMVLNGSGYAAPPTVTFTPAAPVTTGGSGSSGAYTISVSSSTGIYSGMLVVGTGIASPCYVASVTGSNVVLTVQTTGTVSGTLTFTDIGSNATASALLNSFTNNTLCSGAIYLDGYCFVGDNVLGRIYNSDLNISTAWEALNYLSFNEASDNLIGITKHFNYLIAFGQWSYQMYYDGGNINGSPLVTAQSYMGEIGCANGDSIVATEQTVMWLGTSKVYGRSVYMLDGSSPVRISSNAIDKVLERSNLSEVNAYAYKFGGHLMYILTLQDIGVTIVYDMIEKIWYQWTQYVSGSEGYFRATYYADVNQVPIALDDELGNLYMLDPNTYQDNGQPIYWRIVTDVHDSGTTRRKFYQRVEIVGDKVAGTMSIRHYGDDYVTPSAFRTANLAAPRSQIMVCGQDRRRSWEFVNTDNVPLRVNAAEIDFNVGEMDQEQNVATQRYRR